MRSIRPLAVIATALLAVPLAACAPQTTAAPDTAKQDMTKWVMPLDEYWTPATDGLSSYANNLLISECLGAEGIEWPIPWQPTDRAAYMSAHANGSAFPALTVELARDDGYRTNFAPGDFGAPTQEGVDAKRKLDGIAASTPGFQPLFDSCLEQSRRHIDESDAVGISNTILGWSHEATEKAMRSDAAKHPAAKWHDCLKDAGYPVDLDSPLGPGAGMPDQKLFDALGIPPRWQTGDGAPENPLTQAEKDLAVADATCRESSGWTAAMYEAMWDAQAEVVAGHADELVRMRDKGEALREKALKIIAEHAPEK